MAILSAADVANLRIDAFIFHVVHHGEDQPILLEETPLGGFEDFFLARVKDTLKGNRFSFVSGSATRAILREAEDDPRQFVDCSKRLAQDFHSRRDKRIKPGVFILVGLSARGSQFHSLIKYDHEEVLTYALQKGPKGQKAVLQQIANSFTKSPDALHKSALVKLNATSGNLVIIDHTVRADITEFFRGFLDVKRTYNDQELTEQVADLAVQTIKKHRDELPREVTQRARQLAFDAVRLRDTFSADQFFSDVFGAHGSDDVRQTFDAYLEKQDIVGESFKFRKDAISAPRPRKFETEEGVSITIKETALDTYAIKQPKPGDRTTIITIKTKRLTEL